MPRRDEMSGGRIPRGGEVTTIGAAVASCDEAVLLEPCLAALAGFDEIVMFDLESADDSAAIGRAHTATVVAHPRPLYVEAIRGAQLAAATTEWVLFVDPDEQIPPGWLDSMRRVLASTPAEVDGYWVAYQEVAFGRRLEHTRSGAAKIALVRRSGARARPSASVRPHETLLLAGRVLGVQTGIPLIDHHGYRSVQEIIDKIGRYASGGGVSAAPSSRLAPHPLTGIKMLWGAVVMSRAYRDGAPGIAVASLSAISDYLGLLQRWDLAGRPPLEISRGRDAALSAGARLHGTQWRVRRAIRRALRR